jgi:hypothetical protein
MASLKDLLAQKQSGQVKPPVPAAASTASVGTVIRTAPALPPRRDAVYVGDQLITTTPERRLGDPKVELGPDVPFEFASEKPSEAAKEWLLARQQVSTQLGVWMEPPPGVHAWLAVESASDPGRLILLHRLPLLSKPYRHDPF